MKFSDLDFRAHRLPPHWKIASGRTECGLWYNVQMPYGENSNFVRLLWRHYDPHPRTEWDFIAEVPRHELCALIAAWKPFVPYVPADVAVVDPEKRKAALQWSRGPGLKSERNQRIIEAYRASPSIRYVAYQFGLTRSRIHQIIKRDAPELMAPPHTHSKSV